MNPLPASRRMATADFLDSWRLDFGGEKLCLLPEHAIWWEARETLLVADLHLEKGSAFARFGQMLPPYDSMDTLDRLSAVAEDYAVRRIIALGDSFHDTGGPARLPPAARDRLALLESRYEFLWIEGNHDEGGDIADVEMIREGALTLAHMPVAAGKGASQIVGHFHPKIELRANGQHLARRCFVETAGILVMPAFGSYAGGLRAHEIARLYRGREQPAALIPHTKGMLRYPL